MSINSKIFDKNYYYNICLGSEEFKKSGGLQIHPKVKHMINQLNLNHNMDVLEIGCGRGDTALYIANRVKSITGIDYSPEAIKIANKIKKNYKSAIQVKTFFFVMDATKLKFKDKSFDLILFIDTIDHLNNNELEKTFKEITRLLKDDGEVFIRTCSNNILLSKTYGLYTYPLNRLLTWVDKKIKKIDYPSLPADPRTKEQKKQHINEPTYFKLQKLLKKYFENIIIEGEPGFMKEGLGMRTKIYNFVVTLYPLSKYYPLSIFFANSFICKLTRLKKIKI